MTARCMRIAVVVALGASSAVAAARQQAPVRDAAAPRPAAGTASITGTVVVNEPDGRPVRRVTVTLTGGPASGNFPRVTSTDDEGRFSFTRLPAGNYSTLAAARAGFVRVVYGEKRPGGVGVPINLAEGQQLTIPLKIFRGGVITGRIVDDTGKPSPGVNVQAHYVRLVNGQRLPTSAMFNNAGTTDDRGIYRLYGLAPGDYLVVAYPRFLATGEVRFASAEEVQWADRQLAGAARLQPASAAPGGGQPAAPPRSRSVTYTPIFYPGTIDPAGAAPVQVAAGQELSGVDLQSQLVPTVTLEGTVLAPDGQPAENVQVNLIPKSVPTGGVADGLFFESMVFSRPMVRGGTFTIPNVKAGQYTISVRGLPPASALPPPPPGAGARGAALAQTRMAMTLWATQDVTVAGSDQSGIVLRLEPGMTVRGRLTFDGATLQPPADLSRVFIRMRSAPTAGDISIAITPGAAVVGADGTFSLSGVAPGKYFVMATAPAASPVPGATWQLRSARVGAVNAADTPIEITPGEDVGDMVITFTDRAAEVAGTLSDTTGTPTSDFSVILFPVDRDHWSTASRRFRLPVRPGTDGRFRFVNLPAGDYYLAALTDYDRAEVATPAFLDQVVPSAMKVTLEEGERKVQDIRLAAQ